MKRGGGLTFYTGLFKHVQESWDHMRDYAQRTNLQHMKPI